VHDTKKGQHVYFISTHNELTLRLINLDINHDLAGIVFKNTTICRLGARCKLRVHNAPSPWFTANVCVKFIYSHQIYTISLFVQAYSIIFA